MLYYSLVLKKIFWAFESYGTQIYMSLRAAQSVNPPLFLIFLSLDPNGKDLTDDSGSSSDKYSVKFDGRSAMFVIDRVNIYDSGTYTLVASNSHHRQDINLTLHINGTPDFM